MDKKQSSHFQNDIIINSVGAHTSFGGINDSSSAFRCGMLRGQELQDWPYFDEDTLHEQFLIGYPAAGINNGFQGLGRYIKLGALALSDLQRNCNLKFNHIDKLGISYVFPKIDSQIPFLKFLNDNYKIFHKKIIKLSNVNIIEQNIKTHFEGNVGLISAMQEAIGFLEKGYFEYYIIGVIDSLLLNEKLSKLLKFNKIKTLDNQNGFVPSEAACFILLERRKNIKYQKNPFFVTLHKPSFQIPLLHGKKITLDDQHLILGETLSSVMIEALNNAKVGPLCTGTIYSDLNGEKLKAIEYSNALIHLRSQYNIRNWSQQFPALSFGDTGSTNGILSLCLAMRAIFKNQLNGNIALIIFSSESYSHGGVVIEKVSYGKEKE